MADNNRQLVLIALGKGLYKYPDVAANTAISMKDTLEIIRGLILEAIDAQKNTLTQIKKHFGISMSFDISSIIEGMITDKILVKVENFEGSKGFFRAESVPVDFLVRPDSTCQSIYKNDKKQESPKPEKSPKSDPANTVASETEKPQKGYASPVRDKILKNLAQIQTWAMEGKTKGFAADQLEIDKSQFSKYFKTVPELTEHWEKGKAILKETENPKIQKAVSMIEENGLTPEAKNLVTEILEENSDRNSSAKIPVTPEEDEAFEELTKKLEANEIRHKIETDTAASGDYLGGSLPTRFSESVGNATDKNALTSLTYDDESYLNLLLKWRSRGYVDGLNNNRDQKWEKNLDFRIIQTYNEGYEQGRKQRQALSPPPSKESFYDHRDSDDTVPQGDWKIVPASKISDGEKVEIVDVPALVGKPNLEDVEVDPRFAKTIAHLSKNGRSKEGVELAKQKFLSGLPEINFPDDFPRAGKLLTRDTIDAAPQNVKVLEFRGGLTVRMTLEGNMFDAPKEVRRALEDLFDWSEKHANQGK